MNPVALSANIVTTTSKQSVQNENLFWIISVVTVILTIVILAVFVIRKKQQKQPFYPILVGVGTISFSFINSCVLLINPPKNITDISKVINPVTMFLLIFLFNALIIYVIINTIFAIFKFRNNSEMETTLKLPGIEQKITQKDVHTLTTGYNYIDKEFQFITCLNRAIMKYLSEPFEEVILAKPNPMDGMRQEIKDFLVSFYSEQQRSKVKFRVIPLDDREFVSFPDLIAAKLRNLSRKAGNSTDIFENKIGLGVFPGSEDLGTAIIIDSTGEENILLFDAEVSLVGILIVAVTTIIDLKINHDCKDTPDSL